MISASEQKEKLVLDLHNQGKNSREIAEIDRMSFREIGKILRNSVKKKEAEQEQAREELLSSQAYKLFSEGKTPAEVAIELKIRAPLAIMFQREYWNLVQLDNLNQISNEIKHDIWYFVELYRLAKAGGFRVEHIVRLLRIANNDLPLVDCKYENFKTEVNSLEEQKRNSGIRLRELNNQITEVTNYVGHCRASYRQEQMKLEAMRQKRMALEAIVRQFENNNLEYVKIKKTAEEKAHAKLSKGKDLLKLGLFSLTETIRDQPDKYNALFNYDALTTDYKNQQYPPYSYGFYMDGQQQYQSMNYGREDYMALLVEEAAKLYDKLVKEMVDEIISDYSTSTSSTSLPLLPPSDENESKYSLFGTLSPFLFKDSTIFVIEIFESIIFLDI